MTKSATRRLPSSGPARKILQEKGQFWTPDWVAKAMVAWAARDSDHIFDPAIGAGAFLSVAKRLATPRKRLSFFGGELYKENLERAFENGLTAADIAHVRIGDFLKSFGPEDQFDAIVANPPYIRHHRLDQEYKAFLQNLAVTTIGKPIDARAGIHVFFLIKALTHLRRGGRLAFILPSDICEGKFAQILWKWISGRYRIRAAVTFEHAASPFPGVDTNAIVLLIENRTPEETLLWARVKEHETPDFLNWCANDLSAIQSRGISVTERQTNEAMATGLSRPPVTSDLTRNSVPLGSFLKVVRGIATGDNGFFFLTSLQIEESGLPRERFIRAVGRTRDVDGASISSQTLDHLDANGRPTYLLNLDREEKQDLPPALRKYIEAGEAAGLPERALIAQRQPWYRSEKRLPPPWFFAYLGRRNCRFIKNETAAVPLTGFLAVYPKSGVCVDVEAFTRILNDERTLANLPLVAKSYGSGALKVEPRNLERLLIPVEVLRENGVTTGDLFFE